MLKKVIIFFLLIAILGIFAGLFIFYRKNADLNKELLTSQKKIEFLEKENGEIKSQIEYYSHPENLEKELRSKFNYRRPDEKMMIITP